MIKIHKSRLNFINEGSFSVRGLFPNKLTSTVLLIVTYSIYSFPYILAFSPCCLWKSGFLVCCPWQPDEAARCWSRSSLDCCGISKKKLRNFLTFMKISFHSIFLLDLSWFFTLLYNSFNTSFWTSSYPDCPRFLNHHCIIHQQMIYVKVTGFEPVLIPAVKIFNSICSKTTQHRALKILLEELPALQRYF